ncbi:MAG: bifunctional riboflavin kinase/FAD synthetase [Bacteroidota bacterium]
MKVYHGLDELADIPNPVLTTGTFDGVHLGHRKIIDNLKQVAAENNGETVIFTFYPHPRMVIFPDDNDLELLNTQQEKIDLLARSGIDHLIVFPFSKEFSRLSALEFVRDILVNRIGMKHMVIGYDHQFGKNREGNLEHLQELSSLFDFSVNEIPARDIDQVNISSTKIRKALLEGDIATANAFLGYQYPITATVVEGRKLGRTLNFPTANLTVTYRHKLVPGVGVYAVRVEAEGKEYGGMMNIGFRPTVDGTTVAPVPEVHLFDFAGDLYGKEITVRFIDRIRNEMKFPGVDALKEQLQHDRIKALERLETA